MRQIRSVYSIQSARQVGSVRCAAMSVSWFEPGTPVAWRGRRCRGDGIVLEVRERTWWRRTTVRVGWHLPWLVDITEWVRHERLLCLGLAETKQAALVERFRWATSR